MRTVESIFSRFYSVCSFLFYYIYEYYLFLKYILLYIYRNLLFNFIAIELTLKRLCIRFCINQVEVEFDFNVEEDFQRN